MRDPNFLLGPEKGDQLYTRNARHRIYPSVLIEGASRTPTKQQGHSNFQSLLLPKISTAHDHSLLENWSRHRCSSDATAFCITKRGVQRKIRLGSRRDCFGS